MTGVMAYQSALLDFGKVSCSVVIDVMQTLGLHGVGRVDGLEKPS